MTDEARTMMLIGLFVYIVGPLLICIIGNAR